MNKKLQKIIVIFLIIIMLGSTFGYAISSVISTNQNQTHIDNNIHTDNNTSQEENNTTQITYAEKLQEILNKAIKDKNVIKESVLSDLIKRNNAGDYSLTTMLNILGYPVCVLESFDSVEIFAYSDNEEIKKILNNISTNEKYTDKSFVQLYWIKESGETVISWIALGEEDMSEVKTVGIITSQYKLLDDLVIPSADVTTETFLDLSLTQEELIEQYKPFVYQVQNKLLECKFIQNIMKDEYKYVWTEYILKTKDGYIFLNTKDSELYLVYENYYDEKQLPTIDNSKIEQLKNGMTLEEFKEIISNAKLMEVYSVNDSIYTVYVGLNSESKEVTYFDFENDKLMITKTNSGE